MLDISKMYLSLLHHPSIPNIPSSICFHLKFIIDPMVLIFFQTNRLQSDVGKQGQLFVNECYLTEIKAVMMMMVKYSFYTLTYLLYVTTALEEL